MADQKPTLASRLFAGGGSAGLLGDPLFQVGMGLLAKGQDNRIPYATAVMQGLQGAQTARDEATRRQLLADQARREKVKREAYQKAITQLYPNTPGQMAAQPVPSQIVPGTEVQMMGPPTPPTQNPMASLLTALGPEAGSTALVEGLLAKQLGTSAGSAPSAIKEYEYFSKLKPEQQRAFMRVKRADPTTTFAGMQLTINPITGEIEVPGGGSLEDHFDKQLGMKMKEAMQNNQMLVTLENMKVEGAALRDLPIAEIDLREAVRVINQLRVHPGLEDAVGSYFVESIANTEGRNFISKLDGLRGRNFLQAIEALKGSGTITEVEGAKAEAALQSLATSQTEAGFRESLDELERALKVGVDKLRMRANLEAKYIDPETGELREEGKAVL